MEKGVSKFTFFGYIEKKSSKSTDSEVISTQKYRGDTV